MFLYKLYNIKKTLNVKVDRSKLLKEAIQDKLDNSLDQYYKELLASSDYLLCRNNMNVLKKLNKKEKQNGRI